MILITGAAGFIGSNVLAALQDSGQSLTACDWLGNGDKWRNVARHRFDSWVMPEQLLEWLQTNRPKTIFHLGAISSTTETDCDKILQHNFCLSQKLWQWCAKNGARFIYASSAATYGDGSAGFDDQESSDFLATLKPLNPYGWSKHAFDRYVARQVETGAAVPPQWAGLKFFNVYGMNEYHKEKQASVAAQQFVAIREGQPIRLFASDNPDYEDGGQLRDFVYVRDCVRVMMWLYGTPSVSGLFNVGTGQARSFRDLALALFAALQQEPKIEYVPMPVALQGKYQYFTESRMEKLASEGYDTPATPLEEGIEEYVRRYLATSDPWL